MTTYRSGKLVMVRDEGDHLNTHFRVFQAPMGMALHGDRLAVGTSIRDRENANVSRNRKGVPFSTPVPLRTYSGLHSDSLTTKPARSVSEAIAGGIPADGSGG